MRDHTKLRAFVLADELRFPLRELHYLCRLWVKTCRVWKGVESLDSFFAFAQY